MEPTFPDKFSLSYPSYYRVRIGDFESLVNKYANFREIHLKNNPPTSSTINFPLRSSNNSLKLLHDPSSLSHDPNLLNHVAKVSIVG